MSRELKFRVWDKINKVFYYVDLSSPRYEVKNFNRHTNGKYIVGLYAALLSSTQSVYPISEACAFRHDKDLVWQQYVGLRDHQNKEIYEGDIIKFDSYYDGDSLYAAGLATVKCFENSFDLECKGDWMSLWKCVKNDGGIIIGNICEHTDLIR